jgi:hypothetical protein
MDTKYFRWALEEYRNNFANCSVRSLQLDELSGILKRAQELKDADAAARAEEQARREWKTDSTGTA